MCELFTRRGPSIDHQHRGDGGGGAARRDTLPANDNDNRQVTTRHLATSHQHTSVELLNTDIDTFKNPLLWHNLFKSLNRFDKEKLWLLKYRCQHGGAVTLIHHGVLLAALI